LHIGLIDFNFFEYTASLANGLASHIQVSLLVPTNFESVAGTLSPQVGLHYFGKYRLRSPANLKMLAQIHRRIEHLQPDVTHLVAVNPWFNVGLLACPLPNLVTTIHDPAMHAGDLSQRKIPQVLRDLPLRYSKQLIVHGQALKEMMLEKYPISPEQISVIPIGQLSIYKHWNQEVWPEEEGTVLFFGRIWPYKGLDYLIAAEPVITAACPQARFIIAGQGEDFNRYRAMMAHPERFEVRNEYVPREDIPPLFQRASVVVLPYIEASQSAIVPLAYAFGKPVVATKVGGIPDVVSHRQTGLLVSPCDSDALAEAVISLLKDPEYRQRMGECARKRTEADLSWEAIALKTLTVYHSALQGGSGNHRDRVMGTGQ
jgi:glycosyltransferase involved in cell wall biosynthesis